MAKPAQSIFAIAVWHHTLSQAGNALCGNHTSLCTVRGLLCSTVQPTETQVPSISLTVPDRSLEQLRSLMIRAISITSSNDRLPLCLMFFSCRKGGQNPCSTCREQDQRRLHQYPGQGMTAEATASLQPTEEGKCAESSLLLQLYGGACRQQQKEDGC